MKLIHLNDHRAVIESLYLGRQLSSDLDNSKIIVNPTEGMFTKREIIINDLDSISDMESLVKYLQIMSKYNSIISRVKFPKVYHNILDYRLQTYRADRLHNIKVELEVLSECPVDDYFKFVNTTNNSYKGIQLQVTQQLVNEAQEKCKYIDSLVNRAKKRYMITIQDVLFYIIKCNYDSNISK